MKKVDLYYLKFCKDCIQYISDLQEITQKFEFILNQHIIEKDPIGCYKALLEARHSGAFIQHAPFICIQSPDKYKAAGGILTQKQLTQLFKNI